ncbi:hypothetical protein PIB30_061603, partial [Stylosanthes scabra]|nr:hypothetical protein [Stylosanthes scabra]
VLPFPGRRPFWLDDESKPFPWVYWNPEVRECRITTLDPLETLAFQFLQSLPIRLGKKSNFKCRWILDHSDAEVGVLLAYSEIWRSRAILTVLGKKMTEVEGVGPRSILPPPKVPTAATGALASTPATTAPQDSSSGATKTKKKPLVASSDKLISVEKEEGAKEDPPADLNQKRRKQKVQ